MIYASTQQVRLASLQQTSHKVASECVLPQLDCTSSSSQGRADDCCSCTQGNNAFAAPGRKTLLRVIAKKLLLLAPLCHEIALVASEVRPNKISLHNIFGHMPAHLLRGNDGLFSKLRRRQGSGGASFVRESAVAREGIMQPLCEKPPMQRHLPPMHLRHTLQLSPHRSIQLHRLVIAVGEAADDLQHLIN